MLRKVILLITVFFFLSFLSPKAFAAGEFATTNNINYSVDEAGITSVTENITLKNKTDKYYPSSFSLSIGATQISDIEAYDSGGPLEIQTQKEAKKTTIKVNFTNQQVIGLDKEYTWTLKFKSKDFAESIGKVWQVSIPKISNAEDLENYHLTLSVPVSFGDPTTILPEPKNQSENGGRLNLFFDKSQLLESGILANFGSTQVFKFDMTFNLTNDGILPAIAPLPLPASTRYQEVLISNIEPKPENVLVDAEGNYIGYFKVGRRESLQVKVSGLTKLYTKPLYNSPALSEEEIKNYTREQKFWEKDNPELKARLEEIFADKNPQTNQEKAKLIHRFVANFLSYNSDRITKEDFERLGGLTALNNPDKALCQEFTDLFITLSRAAGIPSRELNGFAYTSNKDIRPLSFQGSLLHAWPEYYDEKLGWVMIDPTWENSTGGVDYFSRFDLNHFVLATRGLSSEEPTTANKVSVNLTDEEFKRVEDINLVSNIPQEIIAGLPSKIKIRVENRGNTLIDPSELLIKTAKLTLVGLDKKIFTEKSIDTPPIPPYGSIEYSYNLKTDQVFKSFTDFVIVDFGEKHLLKQVLIKPIFEAKYFLIVVIGAILLVVGIYISVFVAHIKLHKKLNPPKK